MNKKTLQRIRAVLNRSLRHIIENNEPDLDNVETVVITLQINYDDATMEYIVLSDAVMNLNGKTCQDDKVINYEAEIYRKMPFEFSKE